MSLYRIKPLVWEQHGHVHIAKTPVYEFRVGEHGERVTFSIRPAGPALERIFASSVDEAKDTCRRLWESKANQFMESAYQPTTELPTEPGLYWCLISGFRSMWLVTDDGEDAIGFTCLLGSLPDDCKMTTAVNHGQWIRIPEPEVEP